MADDRKTVVVTGAAGGIGRAACERLAKGGWHVLAVDRDGPKLQWTGAHADIHALAADISTPEANAAIAEEAGRLFGALDAAVLNAGVSGGGTIDDMPFERYREIVAINLFGPVLGIKALLPLLRKRDAASIVLTSSTMGLGGDAENWAYGSTKHGVIGLVRSLSREIGWEGIRINALCPGPTQDTGMTSGIAERAPDRYDLLKHNVALQRWADADEMAAVIEFLVSPAASYVTGVALAADGGAITGTGLLPPKAGPGDDAVLREK